MFYSLGFVNGLIFGLTFGVTFWFLNLSSPKPKPSFKIYFLCKITNNKLFDEYFPKFMNASAPRTQPYWEYTKNLIKFEIESDFFKEPTSFETLLEDIDIPLFESFGEIYIYIHYNNLINIYLPESIINLSDFEIGETELSKKYSNLICASIDYTNGKSIYITKHLKSFFNNTIELTPELLTFGLNKTKSLEFSNLQIINKNENLNFSLNEKI